MLLVLDGEVRLTGDEGERDDGLWREKGIVFICGHLSKDGEGIFSSAPTNVISECEEIPWLGIPCFSMDEN